jgi:hypothetical protein
LRDHIVRNFDVDPEALDSTLEEIVQSVCAEFADDRQSAAETLAGSMVGTRADAEEMLVRLLRQGEVSLFEAMFGQMTNLRDNLVHRLIYEPGGEGLAIACRAINVDKDRFAAIFALSRKARPEGAQPKENSTERALGFYDQIDPEAAARILDRWRRNPDYLDLLRQVAHLTRTDD